MSTYDRFFAVLVALLVAGCITLVCVLDHYARREHREFQEYMQQRGYVQLEFHGEAFVVPLQAVPEITQTVKAYDDATRVE